MVFSKYEGQSRSWPTGNAFTDGDFAVPVYRGWPEKPYDVIGTVKFDHAGIDWNRGDLEVAARTAKQAGGDAVILVPRGADPSPTATNTREQLGIPAGETAGVVIRWK